MLRRFCQQENVALVLILVSDVIVLVSAKSQHLILITVRLVDLILLSEHMGNCGLIPALRTL